MASFKLFLFSFLFFLQPSNGDERCRTGCGPVLIRFPFQMNNSLPENRCGYPGFNVTCKNETQQILTFPFSGELRIVSIAYSLQLLCITDPSNCTAKRLLQGFDYSGTPFQPLYTRNFTFLNCTPDSPIFTQVSPIPCLSSESYSVVALPTDQCHASDILRCTDIATFKYPSWGPDDSSDSLGDFITLTWKKPDCQWCEFIGGNCQFRDNIGLDVRCFEPLDPGLSNRAKYALIFILGTPVFVILVFIINHNIRVHCYDQRHQSTVEISRLAAGPQLAARTINGLDRPRIEAYPITLLGESCRLPRPNDNTCSICLSEYQAKERIKTIPDCDHYFHADCIDEWLKLNAACPICRKTPDQGSALITHPIVSYSSSPGPL
ncbi:hypothetical protein DITRI_Ditri07aG0121300 [Diplodiscus trichospermus]